MKIDLTKLPKKRLARKHRKSLRKDQLEVGVVLVDKYGRQREILKIQHPFYTLSHKGTHFIEGRSWTFNQLVEMQNYILVRPLKARSSLT